MKHSLKAVLLSSALLASAHAAIKTEEVTYSAGGVNMKGYIAYDDAIKGKRPGVIIVHEWWGHNAYARKRANLLAQLGYTAFAIDMYGDGKQANHPNDAGKFANEVFQNIEGAKARFTAAMDVLKKHKTVDATRIAAIGYCFGGGVVLHMARFGFDLKGVASFHGSLGTQTPAEKGKVKAAVLVCNGAADPFVTAEQVEALKKEMQNAGVDFQYFAYEGAKHSFTNPDADANGKKFEMPLEYNKAADEKSWAELQQFFKKIFAK